MHGSEAGQEDVGGGCRQGLQALLLRVEGVVLGGNEWTCSLFLDALSASKRGIVKSIGGRCSSAIPVTQVTAVLDKGFRVQIKGVACQADASSHVPLINLRKHTRFSLFLVCSGYNRASPAGRLAGWRLARAARGGALGRSRGGEFMSMGQG